MPCGQCGCSHGGSDEEPSDLVCMMVEDSQEPATEPIQDIRQLQLDDKVVGPVLKAREVARKPSLDNLQERDEK